jgi:zinc protease
MKTVMKSHFFKILVLITISLFSACASIPSRPDALGNDPLEFSPRKVESWELANGLKVFYLFDDELPHVKGTLYFPGGSLYEPQNLAGLASATGAQMRDGAIQGVSPEQFDKQLADLAATIETSFSDEFGSASFYGLSEDFEKVIKLFSQIVLKPGFNDNRLALWKKIARESIRRRRDDPSAMAGMAFNNLLYGTGSPFSNQPDFSSVDRISREDMVKFHQTFLRPDRAILAVSGNITRS